MPTREELDVKERADRALRAGRAREALGLYGTLLSRVHVFSRSLYDGWLEGAFAAYQALGRRREAGYVLLVLRRFADAQRHFSADDRPLEWALCASKLGHYAEAARALSVAGHPVLAAMELEEGGLLSAARAEWERTFDDPRLEGQRYQKALVHLNLGECLLKMNERAAAERELGAAQRLLEELADDFESGGNREAAFECYAMLLRIGKDGNSFENVAEGYLNAIRLAISDDRRFLVLQYYDDFLAYALERGELYAAATLAREAADFSANAGLVFDRHYLARSAELWSETAKHNLAAGGPSDLSENALHAGIDAATAWSDLETVARLYAELAALPLPAKKRERYQTLAARYSGGHVPPRPPIGFPDHLRRSDAYHDTWRTDLVEWELEGDPAATLAHVIVDHPDHVRWGRIALRALLQVGAPGFSIDDVGAASELALSLGRVQQYEVLPPMEKLYERNRSPEVRAAVMTGVGQVFVRRSFDLVRRGLEDPAERVREEALKAMRKLHFFDALDALAQIFRDASDEKVRTVALETISDIRSVEAGMFLLDAVLHETGAVQAVAQAKLRALQSMGDELAPELRRVLDAEQENPHSSLRRLLSDDVTSAGPPPRA